METKVLEFLSNQRIAALTTLLPDGSPHAAAVHYAYTLDPLTIYISTENTSRKCTALLTGETVTAAMVVGFSEEEWLTLQLDGTIRAILDKNQLADVYPIFYDKNPSSEKYKDDPATVFLAFTPTWWRYSDYNTDPVSTISSE